MFLVTAHLPAASANSRTGKARKWLSDFGVMPLPKRSKKIGSVTPQRLRRGQTNTKQCLFRMMVPSQNPWLVTT
jgi:hypothetical protein